MRPAVSGTRSYANLKLNVARLQGTGKTSMEERNKDFVDQALASLPRSHEQATTFLCVHKGLEGKLKAGTLNQKGVQIDHWGNIDGRNDWKDCSRGVFLGLPYLPPEWPKMMKLAVHAAHHNATETDRLLIGLPDRLQVSDDELSDARIAAALVQAINRIRCRKVIDSYGNCPAAEAFVTLPPGQRGDRILSRLKLELPGVKTARWEFTPSDELSVPKAEYAEGPIGCGESSWAGRTPARRRDPTTRSYPKPKEEPGTHSLEQGAPPLSEYGGAGCGVSARKRGAETRQSSLFLDTWLQTDADARSPRLRIGQINGDFRPKGYLADLTRSSDDAHLLAIGDVEPN